jgi:predicted dehydrogenase
LSHTPLTTENPAGQPRWGILGTGWIARLFVADLVLTGHQVVAVGSRSAQTAAAFASEFGIAQAHSSYEALVTDPSVDVVYVATPHPRHHDDAALALRAGKHVLVEKPFTINASEAESLVLLASERKLLILEAMWTRWLPHMIAVRKLIADGAIGEVRSIIADHTQKLPGDPAHRINALELGGGALLDLGVYPISLASDLLGTPLGVEATATFKATGADAETAILLRYADERTAVIYTASNAPGPNRAAIVGTDGRIEIDSVWYTPTSFRLYNAQGGVVSTYDSEVPGRGMQFQADETERLISAGLLASETLPPSETVSIMATMDQIRRKIGLRYPTE